MAVPAAAQDLPPPDEPESGEGLSGRQLDFYQAMHDFKEMFPTLDEEVIEAVLRSNNGAVDGTIDQLLTMNTDFKDDEPDSGDTFYMNQKGSDKAKNDDGDRTHAHSVYNDYANVSGHHMRRSTSPIPEEPAEALLGPEDWSPTKPASVDLLATASAAATAGDVDDLDVLQGAMGPSLSQQIQKEIEEAAQQHSSTSAAIHFLEDELPPTPPMPPKMNLLEHNYVPDEATAKLPPLPDISTMPKRPPLSKYRNWNPPMLGTLPDDFLRINVEPSEFEHHPNCPHHPQLPMITSPPSPQPIASPPIPRSHRHPSATVKRHHSLTMPSPRSPAHSKDPPPTAVAASQSPSRTRSLTSTPASSSSSSGARERNTHLVRSYSAAHGRDELNTQTLRHRMVELERQRSRAGSDLSANAARMLDDERLALYLQNEEFVDVLRQDEDFVKHLQKDRMRATAFEGDNNEEAESPVLDSNRPSSEKLEGYGDDGQDMLGAFPFSKDLDTSKKAEFQRQLKTMGGTSKKRFMTLAKKFFSRKKKSPKQILKNSAAPSTVNLLDEEDVYDFPAGPGLSSTTHHTQNGSSEEHIYYSH